MSSDLGFSNSHDLTYPYDLDPLVAPPVAPVPPVDEGAGTEVPMSGSSSSLSAPSFSSPFTSDSDWISLDLADPKNVARLAAARSIRVGL